MKTLALTLCLFLNASISSAKTPNQKEAPFLTPPELLSFRKNQRQDYLDRLEKLGHRMNDDLRKCIESDEPASCRISYFVFTRNTAQRCLKKGCHEELVVARQFRDRIGQSAQ